MKKIELYLKYMNRLKSAAQSIDIYYNDLEPEFVVKVIDGVQPENTRHFRNTKLKLAIEKACSYLLNESRTSF